MSIPTYCNAGCTRPFTIEAFKVDQLPKGIEKTYFTCPFCQREYIAHYTDGEIRSLQDKIRKVQQRFLRPHYNHQAAANQEAKLKRKIAEKMDALRQRVEKGLE